MRKNLFALLLIAAVIIPACSAKATPIQVPQASYFPTQGWHTSTPEAQGFDSAKVAEGFPKSLSMIHSRMTVVFPNPAGRKRA